MKNFPMKSLLVLALLLFVLPAFAFDLKNLKATPDGTYLEFSWDPIPISEIDQQTHYALQWSKLISDVRIDKPTSAPFSLARSYYRLRGDLVFERNIDYYVRVYTYYREEGERKTYLANGSKILKFKWLSNGNIETSIVEPNDPNIINSGDTTVAAKEFGHLSAVAYDTSVQLTWVRVDETHDKYVLVFSENSALTSPVAELRVDKGDIKALVTNLKDSRRYFVAGYLERNGRKFGKGQTISFNTLPKFDAEKQMRYQKYVLDRRNYGVLLDSKVTAPAVTEASTSSISSTSSSYEITARITALKRLIAKYQLELRSLETKTTISTTSTTTLSSFRSLWLDWGSR